MRVAALVVFAATLMTTATLQGWELGIPVWLGIFSFVFVAGLFLSSQKPDWHPKTATVIGAIGIVLGLGALVL